MLVRTYKIDWKDDGLVRVSYMLKRVLEGQSTRSVMIIVEQTEVTKDDLKVSVLMRKAISPSREYEEIADNERLRRIRDVFMNPESVPDERHHSIWQAAKDELGEDIYGLKNI